MHESHARCLFLCALCFGAIPALAQPPHISVAADIVMPGVPVNVTITATPGLNVALVGSSTGAGFVYGGIPLAVGPDVQVLFIGAVDGTGQRVVSVTPPFVGTMLDRYYLLGVASAAPNFIPPLPSPGLVLRNGDLLSGLGATGPPGPTGPTGGTGPQGPPATIASLAGLAGNGTAASPLAVDFDTDGVQTKVSRSDHAHAAPELQAGALGSGVTIPGGQVSGTVANAAALGGVAASAYALASDQAGGPWFACGTLAELNAQCSLPSYPTLAYQYGMAYNSMAPVPMVCTWATGAGLTFFNEHPYLIFTNNPSVGYMRYGGPIFYRGTDAVDDDVCEPNWRHKYWVLDVGNLVSTLVSNGCAATDAIYCRKR